MRLLIKGCLLAAALLSCHVHATELSRALLLPQSSAWEHLLTAVIPPRTASTNPAPAVPFVEQFELALPSADRIVGKVVFDRPIDLSLQTLNLYFDLDNNEATGRLSGEKGAEVMLGLLDTRRLITTYSADGQTSSGHLRTVLDGNVLWFTFHVPPGVAVSTVRAYVAVHQPGTGSGSIPRQSTVTLTDADLLLESLVVPSQALLLPEYNTWEHLLTEVIPPRTAGTSPAPAVPFAERFELALPSAERIVGKVVFDRPVDLSLQTLNLYFDLDNNDATGRLSGAKGVDVMLGLLDTRRLITTYSADGQTASGHLRTVLDGHVLWFSFQVPDGVDVNPVRAYVATHQTGKSSSSTPLQATTTLTDGDLLLESLMEVNFPFPAPTAANIPQSVREELAIDPNAGLATVVYENRVTGGNWSAAPLVQRWSAMHLGGDRILFQIDTERVLAPSGEQLVIYLDVDDDPDTGRTDTSNRGIDLMLVLANNSLTKIIRNNDLSPQLVKTRGRQVGRSIYLVFDAEQLELSELDVIRMRGYILSEGRGMRSLQTSRVTFELPVSSATPDPLPPVDVDLLSTAGYRYLQNSVAYESLENKGIAGADIRKRGYQPLYGTPLPLFLHEATGVPSGPVTSLRVPVTVLEDAGVARTDAVVRFGFPLPQGEVFSTADVTVVDSNDQPHVAQVQGTALWPDGSFRWLVIDLRDAFTANEEKTYEVVLGAATVPTGAAITVSSDEDEIVVSTGALRTTIDLNDFRGLANVEVLDGANWLPVAGSENGFVIVDEQGTTYSSANLRPNSVSVEEETDGRVTLRIAGEYAATGGQRYMSYVCRLTFYAASTRVDLALTHINTRLDSEFSDFRSLDYALRLSAPVAQVQVLTVDGSPLVSTATTAQLLQMSDDDGELNLAGTSTYGHRLPGALRVQMTNGRALTLAVTDFWQRWPKGIVAQGQDVQLQLLPLQPSASFGSDLPYYLMYPFVDGFYRLKWGMAFTERMSFDFSATSSVDAVWAEAQQPLIAVVPAQWYADTEALIPIAVPQGTQFALWDNYIANSLVAHLNIKDVQGAYGFLNYGDWFGERGRNWGNNEYDMPHTFFSQFVRTGNRNFFRAALAGVRHQADSDIVHAYPDPYYVGANHPHSIGHTGQWSEQVANASWSFIYDTSTHAGNGHTWTDGMMDSWVLVADPVVMEAALKLGDHISFAFAPTFTELGSHERSAGWSLRALMALYRGTGDPVYLQAASLIGEVALQAQDKVVTGVWPHELPSGHAGGVSGIMGNNVFLIGVLLNGLAAYHAETGDPRYAEALAYGGSWLKDGWDDVNGGWPYSIAVDGTPVARTIPSLNPLIYSALLYDALLKNDADSITIVEAAIASTLTGVSAESFGKDISLKGFFMPESLGRLQQYYDQEDEQE